MTTPLKVPSEGQSLTTLVNATTGRILADDLTICLGLTSRFIGLMGRNNFAQTAAIGLVRCDWVHTFLVKFPIDLVYCDRAGRALRVSADVRPNRFAARAAGAHWAYEMRAGSLAPFVTPGDILFGVESFQTAVPSCEEIPCA